MGSLVTNNNLETDTDGRKEDGKRYVDGARLMRADIITVKGKIDLLRRTPVVWVSNPMSYFRVGLQ